jgi:N-acetylglucosamine-6-phosphate deacetylase
MGHEVTGGDTDEIRAISKYLPACGVTSWLPTTATASVEEISTSCEAVGSFRDEASCARVQGLFLEGPFFTERYKGAQNPKYLRPPDVGLFDAWQERACGRIRKVALAPEAPGALAFCREVADGDVKVALGHSDATFEEALAAIDCGASIFVHTYNAMSPLHHRAPGMVGAALCSDATYAELICDGHHVSPGAAEILVRARGHGHVALITDCVASGGLPDGEYDQDGLPVVLGGGAVRLKDGGNLAGSVLRLVLGVKNVVSWGVATLEEALRMASEVPARANGIDGDCGSIRPGRAADFIVLDQSLDLVATYVGGRIAAGGREV